MSTKLRFWHTFGDAFAFVFHDFPRFIRMSVAWVVLSAILFVIVVGVLGLAAVKGSQTGATLDFDLGRSLASFIFGVFNIATNVIFAVAWHRAVLLGEQRQGMQVFRLHWREWRFFFYSLGVGLLAMLVFLISSGISFGLGLVALPSFPHEQFPFNPWVFAIVGPVFFIVMIAMIPFFARFSLGLPAIAVEEPPGVFRRSWHRGRHNGWRLFWGPVLCSIPLGIVAGVFSGVQAASALIATQGGVWLAVGFVLMLIFFSLSYWAHFLSLAVAVSFLSMAYRYLRGSETLPSAAAASAPL